MANQRPHNKTLTLTTSPQTAKSYCTTPVGTLTAVNQVKQCRSRSGLQTERHFNGILGAPTYQGGGSSRETPVSVGNNEVIRCIMRQLMGGGGAARHEGFQALFNINLSKQVLDCNFFPCVFSFLLPPSTSSSHCL